MDVEKAREHFDQRAARERHRGRARGARLIVGYYAGALLVLAIVAAVALARAVSGG